MGKGEDFPGGKRGKGERVSAAGVKKKRKPLRKNRKKKKGGGKV